MLIHFEGVEDDGYYVCRYNAFDENGQNVNHLFNRYEGKSTWPIIVDMIIGYYGEEDFLHVEMFYGPDEEGNEQMQKCNKRLRKALECICISHPYPGFGEERMWIFHVPPSKENYQMVLDQIDCIKIEID